MKGVTTPLESLLPFHLLSASAAASVLDRGAPLGIASAAMAPAYSAAWSGSALGSKVRKGVAANTVSLAVKCVAHVGYLILLLGGLDEFVGVQIA